MRREKLFYIPGLISLLGLPVLMFFFKPTDQHKQVVVKLYLPSDDTSTPGIGLSKYYVYSCLHHKKIIHISLIQEESDSLPLPVYRIESRLRVIQTEMERLQFTHDTNSVIQVDFDKNATYGQFVWVLNQANILDYKRYALVGNSFYFFTNPALVEPKQLEDTVIPIYL